MGEGLGGTESPQIGVRVEQEKADLSLKSYFS